jgi:hypothetical protein
MKDLRNQVRAYRRLAFRIGALLAEMEDGDVFLEGCSSIEHLGEVVGLSALEARQMMRVALASPAIRNRVDRASISLASGAHLARLFSLGEAYVRGVDWGLLAETVSTRRLKYLVDRHIAEVRQGARPVERRFFLPQRVSDDFDRAHDLVSRRAGEVVPPERALGTVLDDWLDGNDPLRKEPGPRRMPDTTGKPDRRVPVAVRLATAKRSGDRCPVPFCDNRIFLDDAHVVAFAAGGNQEKENLFRPCWRHHRLYDECLLGMEGSPESPRFFSRDGRPLDRRSTTQFGPEDDVLSDREREIARKTVLRTFKKRIQAIASGEGEVPCDELRTPYETRRREVLAR